MTVSTETVRMARSRPEKNQSERADLPCHIIRDDYGLYTPLVDHLSPSITCGAEFFFEQEIDSILFYGIRVRLNNFRFSHDVTN